MNPFEDLPREITHLLSTLAGQELWGPFTTYTPFIILILALVVLVVFVARKQLSLVPRNRFVGVIEFFVDFTKNEIGYGVLGPAAKKHIPFLLSIFIFILISNLIGIIPGSKAATGTMGTTVALTIISFVYFTFYGIKHHGLGRYILSFAPHGVKPVPLAAFVWLLEFASMLLRLLTLSVRLFANMFAGHILLGTLAILTTLFITPFIQTFSADVLGLGGVGVLWLILLAVLYAMELFVAVIQAFIFTLLSSVYVMLATMEH
ncbi:MAG: F0F1 ATP synthase subunit A [Coriobacteriales bacterium]|jgi:F-type H+-transporting ATPase subunit a|nr:F0F1 ATP synthase subunit A [Coriobacteriales bacterium]